MKQKIMTIIQQNVNLYRTFAVLLSVSIVVKTNFRLFNKTLFYSNNNTPPRLTPVAHLGGFSFYTGV
ncbi:hypothetical protein P700755_002978 [Psychroflexus torquis ATCC 700755]|uniref:Uncharacterized protein n=1 Tax=Psychroflexus torquis (strain ATCC 700755 / CIP 106069 / ACAM 623) TaxID=313595 RepID=K4IW34_PSYTT|nr:hypothetical protein P700755_002978 [Psychroflexus torquis ATCC 700755]